MVPGIGLNHLSLAYPLDFLKDQEVIIVLSTLEGAINLANISSVDTSNNFISQAGAFELDTELPLAKWVKLLNETICAVSIHLTGLFFFTVKPRRQMNLWQQKSQEFTAAATDQK